MPRKKDYYYIRSHFPYNQVGRYSVYDKFGNFCGCGNTPRECTRLIATHKQNDLLVDKYIKNKCKEQNYAKKKKQKRKSR